MNLFWKQTLLFWSERLRSNSQFSRCKFISSDTEEIYPKTSLLIPASAQSMAPLCQSSMTQPLSLVRVVSVCQQEIVSPVCLEQFSIMGLVRIVCNGALSMESFSSEVIDVISCELVTFWEAQGEDQSKSWNSVSSCREHIVYLHYKIDFLKIHSSTDHNKEKCRDWQV